MALPHISNVELLGATSPAALIVDSAGSITTTNRAAEALFGFTQEELIGRPVSEICVLDKGVLHGDASATCTGREGQTFPAVVSKVSLGIDGSACELYTFRIQSERILRGLGSNFEEAILELSRSPAARDEDFSSAAARITKLVAEVIDVERVSLWLIKDGGTLLECMALYEKSSQRLTTGTKLRFDQYPNYFRALEEGRSIAATDAMRDPRTSEFATGYLDVLGITSMLDSVIRVAGKVVGVVCHEQVGEPRIWKEDEIIFAGEVADLAGMSLLAEKNREAETVRLKLEADLREAQKLEAIGRLAGGVAHDFNNLLAVILGQAEFALEMDIPDEQKACFFDIHEAGRKAAELTNQLLSIGRRQVLRSEPIDLNALVRDQLGLIRSTLPDSIELEFNEFAPRAITLGDSGQLERVLLNLCMNSRDALPEGGRISLSTRIEPSDESGGSWVVLRVADNGIGMSEHVRERVFEPFFTTKGESGGTGLGLPTVHGIAHQHNGYIEVTSQPGQGTSVDIFLPIGELTAAPQPAAPQEGSLERGAGRILVAEDSASIRRFLSRLLEHAGYTVHFASDGEEALELCRKHVHELDLVLLDVLLPKLTGTEVFKYIREFSPEIPVLFITGYDQETLGPAVKGQKNVTILPKPWDSKTLLAAVHSAIAKP